MFHPKVRQLMGTAQYLQVREGSEGGGGRGGRQPGRGQGDLLVMGGRLAGCQLCWPACGGAPRQVTPAAVQYAALLVNTLRPAALVVITPQQCHPASPGRPSAPP
jgi:hypothetical protein